MEAILGRLLVPDKEVIKAATDELRAAFKHPGVVPELCLVLNSSTQPPIRQYAAVLLRKKFAKAKSWNKLNNEEQTQIKAGCIASLQSEQEKSVSSALCQLIAVIARHELPKGWQELEQFIMASVSSQVADEQVRGLRLVREMSDTAGEQMQPGLRNWLQLLRKTLDGSEEVCFLSILALSNLTRQITSDEATFVQHMIPTVLTKLQELAKHNEERATEALDIFDDLIECEVGVVIPHIKPMVELCIALAAEASLDDPIRIKAVTFLGRLTRLKKKTIVKHKLYQPIIQIIFSIMTQNEMEDDDEDAEEDDDSPALAASQALDTLALNLPPEKYISALMKQVEPALAQGNPYAQRAAYQALAVSAEGCQDHIRKKYLNNFLQSLGNGIRSEQQIVRNSALYMLGQFSEFIQPEISNYAGDILPVLFQYLDTAFAGLKPGEKESSSVSRIFYALDTFCENLEDKLVPYLSDLMQRALAALSESYSIRVRELGITLIGSAANAVKNEFIPYFDNVLAPLQGYLTMQHTDETQVLLTSSMSTLGILARCVGKDKFSREFADQCITIGMQVVNANDADPDVRRCAYSLFGAVATIVKEDMAAVLEPCVVMMLKSLQSTEGIHLEMNGDADEQANLPLENLDDCCIENGDICLDDASEGDDDLEDVKAIGVENAYVSEKEQALLALKELSVECGQAFYPYIIQSMEESWTLLDYPQEEVRAAAIVATAFFLIAFSKSADGMASFTKGTTDFIPKLCEMIEEESEHVVVLSSLEALTEMLKQCKLAVTTIPEVPQKIFEAITKIMKNECACQDKDEEDGMEDEEEEAEQDEMLFQYAGDVLPALGRAMTPDLFAPCVMDLLQLLLKKTRKQCSIPERSFAVGALADCIEPLTGRLDQLIPHALPVFMNALNDEDEDVRNNAVYGLGELVLWGGQPMATHYNQILSNLSNLLGRESEPRVIDQIVGAVARFVTVSGNGASGVPVNEILPVMINNLPLKEDMDEYESVFKALTILYSAGHECIKSNIGKILECAVQAQVAREIDKEKILPIVSELVKRLMQDFPAELQATAATLPPTAAKHLEALTT